MSDNDRSREGVSDKNCGTCRWAAMDPNSVRGMRIGNCAYRTPVPWAMYLQQTRSIFVADTDERAPDGTTGWDCPTWQAKEAAANAERGVTCTGCELADDCPGFADCPRLAAAKAEGER